MVPCCGFPFRERTSPGGYKMAPNSNEVAIHTFHTQPGQNSISALVPVAHQNLEVHPDCILAEGTQVTCLPLTKLCGLEASGTRYTE